MNQAKRSNQEQAPICAAFVEEFRKVFGEVKVLHVQEGSFEIGKETDGWVPVVQRAANDGAL